jgi:hypothetical protein
MANVAISALTTVTTVVPQTDVLPLVSGGATTRATPNEIVKAALESSVLGASQLATSGYLITKAPTTVTATTYTVNDGDSSIICNPSGTLTLTLPAASSFSGRWLHLKNIQNLAVNSASSNIVAINSATAGTSILAGTAGKWCTLQSDGTNWVIMASN